MVNINVIHYSLHSTQHMAVLSNTLLESVASMLVISAYRIFIVQSYESQIYKGENLI